MPGETTQGLEGLTQRTQRVVEANAKVVGVDAEVMEGFRSSAGRFCGADWEKINKF